MVQFASYLRRVLFFLVKMALLSMYVCNKETHDCDNGLRSSYVLLKYKPFHNIYYLRRFIVNRCT